MNKQKIWFWIAPSIFGILVLTVIRLVSDVPTEAKFWNRPIALNLIEVVSAIVIAYLFQFGMVLYVRKRALRTGELTPKKLLLEYLMMLMIGFVIMYPCVAIIHFFTKDPLGLDDIVIAGISFSLLLVIAYAILRGNQLLQAYVDQKTKTQQITNIQMETELKFLKAQFHPHFLFNALNTIYFQIDEANEAPRKSIEQLAELLRYQLYDVNQTVRIEQELHFIRNYADFQQVRMKESLRVEIDFDSLLKEQKIHPLLLFPLVENAYKYVGGEYRIQIKAYRENNALRFSVENSIPPDIKPVSRSGGVGLENLRRRLDLLYTGKYRLELNRTEQSYTANLTIAW
ncbi:MAG: sensor histidine kinase [Bacteroidetes bacterium]|nr:sensor histidine kinase [Bacteroidota bacterium]